MRSVRVEGRPRETVVGSEASTRRVDKRRSRKGVLYIMESLILAQNERWRRVLSMQVGR